MPYPALREWVPYARRALSIFSPRHCSRNTRNWRVAAFGCLAAHSLLYSPSIFTQEVRVGSSLPSSELKVDGCRPFSNDGTDEVLGLVLDILDPRAAAHSVADRHDEDIDAARADSRCYALTWLEPF
jgi:hypothetical protein